MGACQRQAIDGGRGKKRGERQDSTHWLRLLSALVFVCVCVCVHPLEAELLHCLRSIQI